MLTAGSGGPTHIVRIALLTLLNLLLIFLVGRMLVGNPNEIYLQSKDAYVYSRGNAPDGVRAEVLKVLRQFAEGYEKRDGANVMPFMEGLFSRRQISILGTMPREVYGGFDRAARLVASDWRSWGDCRFVVENAHVSSHGDAAWISTIGRVRFDLSRYLIVPLRLSAVLVKEDGGWKFQQMQFQFDLDLSFALVTLVLLLAWLLVNVILLLVAIRRSARQSGGERSRQTPRNA